MEIGAAIFFTDYSMEPTALAVALNPEAGLRPLRLPQSQMRAGRIDDNREGAGVRHLGDITRDLGAE